MSDYTHIQLDAIGPLTLPPATGDDGQPLPEAEPTPLPGWHVNATHPVPGWAAWRVTPATPRRVFSGAETVFYTFPDEAAYLTALDAATLSVPRVVPPRPRHITKLAFRNRFTQAEKVALEIAQLDDPAKPMTARAQAAALRASQADVLAGSYIDLGRADTRAGVQQLEAVGLLAKGRAAEILDAEIKDFERPQP